MHASLSNLRIATLLSIVSDAWDADQVAAKPVSSAPAAAPRPEKFPNAEPMRAER